jgi:hypothetical protein
MAQPNANPPAAMITKLTVACASENAPVATATAAKCSATRPDASFMSDSPCRICSRRAGTG